MRLEPLNTTLKWATADQEHLFLALTEWETHFSYSWTIVGFLHHCMCACMFSHFSRVRLFVTLWTVAHQAPLSKEFSRQEDWRGLPFPSPRDLPNLEIKLVSDFVSCIAGGFFTHWATWEALYSITLTKMRNSFGKEGSKIGSVLLFFCLLGSRCLLDKRKDLLALGMLSLGLQGEVRGGNFQRSGPLKSGWYLKPWGPVYSWDPRLIQKSAFTVRRKEGARGKARKHHQDGVKLGMSDVTNGKSHLNTSSYLRFLNYTPTPGVSLGGKTLQPLG